MKYPMTLVTLLLLSGCGGGGDNTQTTEVVKTNTAPTMTGTFSVNSKAETMTSAAFDLIDAENDTITVTIANQPNWLTYKVENKQLILEVAPSLFDLGSTQLNVAISDGKLSNSYPLTVNVDDNPSKWYATTAKIEEFTGTWRNAANDTTLSLQAQGPSLYVQGNRAWFARQENDATKLNFELTDYNCESGFGECAADGNISLKIIAKSATQLRAQLTNNDGTSDLTFVNNQTNTINGTLNLVEHNYKKAPFLLNFNQITTENHQTNKILVPLKLYPKTPGIKYFSWTDVAIEGYFDNGNFIITKNDSEADATIQLARDGSSRYFDFTVKVTAVNFQKITDSKYLVNSTIVITPTEEITNTDLQDYAGLADYIATKNASSLLQPVEKTTFNFEKGKTYVSKFINEQQGTFAGLSYLVGDVKLTISTDTSGYFTRTTTDGDIASNQPVSLIKSADALTIGSTDRIRKYEFYKTLSGETVMSTNYYDDNGNIGRVNLTQLNEYQSSFTEADYQGLVIQEPNEGLYIDFTMPLSHYYMPELSNADTNMVSKFSNGKFLFMSKYSCHGIESFDECETLHIENNESYAKRSLELYKNESGDISAIYSVYYSNPENPSSSYTYETIRRFKKVNF